VKGGLQVEEGRGISLLGGFHTKTYETEGERGLNVTRTPYHA
jgi:hypothetical protein